MNTYRSRLMIDVTPELLDRVRNTIPHGLRGQLYTAILEDILDLIDKEGEIIIALMIRRKLSVTDVSSTLKEGLDDIK